MGRLKLVFMAFFCIFLVACASWINTNDYSRSSPYALQSQVNNGHILPQQQVQAQQRAAKQHVFPYDLVLDTAAYTNCSAVSNSSVFFGLKFGSYNEGLKLDDNFLSINRNEPTYTSLQGSPYLNSHAILSISQIGNPLNVASIAGTRLEKTLALGTRLSLENLARFKKTRNLNKNQLIEFPSLAPSHLINQITPYIGRTHAVNLHYGSPIASNNNNISAQPIVDKERNFYGKTYNIEFNQDQNTLSNITETNLLNDKKLSTWTCPKKLKFVIHRHQNNTYHKTNNKYFAENNLDFELDCVEDLKVLSRREKAFVEALFPQKSIIIGRTQHLDGSLDKSQLCIKPSISNFQCYPQDIVLIEFNKDKECNNQNNENLCPSELSICMRK